MEDTKILGTDLFLLDDGWFGNKYPRDNDRLVLVTGRKIRLNFPMESLLWLKWPKKKE